MEDLSFIDMTVRLILATLLTGLIGFEREATGKAAGLRTHAMVGFGSGNCRGQCPYDLVSVGGLWGRCSGSLSRLVITSTRWTIRVPASLS